MAKDSKSGKKAAPKSSNALRLETPTDLSGNAVPEIAEALNGLVADSYAPLYQDHGKKEFPLRMSRGRISATIICCSTTRRPRFSPPSTSWRNG